MKNVKCLIAMLCGGLILLIAASGCNLTPSPLPLTVQPPIISTSTKLTFGFMPPCSPGNLGKVSGFKVSGASVIGSASSIVPVISGNPTLNWNYDASTCAAGGFLVVIGTENPDLTFNLVGQHIVSGSTNSLTLTDPLAPATEYKWMAYPFSADASEVTLPTSVLDTPLATFFTAPLCTGSSALAPVQTYPADGATETGKDEILSWSYPSACLPQSYELVRSTDPNMGVDVFQQTLSYFTHVYDWLDPSDPSIKDCTTYYWKVGASNDGANYVYSTQRSFYLNLSGTCPGTTPEPPAPPTGLTVTLAINANCHHGPGLEYDVASYGLKGENYKILGVNGDGTWLYIQFNATLDCWVDAASGTASGSLTRLPVIPAPTDTPAASAPFDCSQFNGKGDACLGHGRVCSWTGSKCVNR